jgi:adenylate cyclase 1
MSLVPVAEQQKERKNAIFCFNYHYLVLIILIICVVVPSRSQVSALPRTLILLLLFLTAFIWISAILMLIMAARLKWIYWDVAQSFSLRLAITVFTIILLYSVGQMNVVSHV